MTDPIVKTQKVNEFQPRSTIPARRFLPVICLFCIGVAASFVIFWLVNDWEMTKQRSEFESRANAYTNAVESTLNEYAGAIFFLGDYFNNSPPVSRQQFDNIVKSILPRYPGIQAFGWDPLVKDAERAIYESAAKKDGYAEFEFTERSETNKLVRAARRREYVIVYYIYPLESNRPALGFDIASNKIRLEAINKAFDTGKLTATGRITLVQETGNQYGTLILLPIYNQGVSLNNPEVLRKNRKGFVVEVLRIGTAIETALKGFTDEGLFLALYDMSAEEGNRFLYRWPSSGLDSADQPIPSEGIEKGLLWSKTLDFASRKWKILVLPSDFYYQTQVMWHALAVLLGSLLLTTLLAFYMLRGVRYTAEVEQRVHLQTRTNRQLENEIRERTAAEAERDKTILDLQQALDEVKTLRGILPICSFCKKVRDDKGYWEQVDIYINKHSQASPSHSICPDCAKKHYPYLYFDKD